MDNAPTLSNIERNFTNVEHECATLAEIRQGGKPLPYIAEITLAMRKAQEAIMYVQRAKEKASKGA